MKLGWAIIIAAVILAFAIRYLAKVINAPREEAARREFREALEKHQKELVRLAGEKEKAFGSLFTPLEKGAICWFCGERDAPERYRDHPICGVCKREVRRAEEERAKG